MKKTILSLIAIIIALPSYSAIKTFTPHTQIKAIDVNANFNEVKQILVLKNTPISFNQFQPGTVIKKENVQPNFDLDSLKFPRDPNGVKISYNYFFEGSDNHCVLRLTMWGKQVATRLDSVDVPLHQVGGQFIIDDILEASNRHSKSIFYNVG